MALDLLYIFFVLKYFPDNYGTCRFWEKDKREWDFYYGSTYNPYARRRLRKLVQRYPYQIVFDDKDLFERFAQRLRIAMPRSFGLSYPPNRNRERIASVMLENDIDELFVKPITGHAGQGIMKAIREPEGITLKTINGEIEINELQIKDEYVLQEGVIQHDAIARIAPFSVNTIRVIAMLTLSGEVLVIGACIRFSNRKDMFIDNVCAGGLAVYIDSKTGILGPTGYDFFRENLFDPPGNRHRVRRD